MPDPPSGVECPYIGAPPRVQWRGKRLRIGFEDRIARFGPQKLEMWCGNARAIAASHQHAILGFAQIGDAHGKPDSHRRQRNGEGEGRDVGQHAMAKIVRFVPRPLVARKIVRLTVDVLLESRLARIPPPCERVRRGARPKLAVSYTHLRAHETDSYLV